MRNVLFQTDLFQAANLERSERALSRYLDLLTDLDLDYLSDNPGTPPLYHAGVRYRREPLGQESWSTIPIVLRLGHGDCEDLACWRASEIRSKGGQARAVWKKRVEPSGVLLYHILVETPGGIEDPSKRLGMR